jgi:hypothetical protein
LPVASHFSCSCCLLYGKVWRVSCSCCMMHTEHAMRRTVGRATMQQLCGSANFYPHLYAWLVSREALRGPEHLADSTEKEAMRSAVRPAQGYPRDPLASAPAPPPLWHSFRFTPARTRSVGRWGEGRDLSRADLALWACEPPLGSRVQTFLSVGENVVVDGSSPRRPTVRGWLAIAARRLSAHRTASLGARQLWLFTETYS